MDKLRKKKRMNERNGKEKKKENGNQKERKNYNRNCSTKINRLRRNKLLKKDVKLKKNRKCNTKEWVKTEKMKEILQEIQHFLEYLDKIKQHYNIIQNTHKTKKGLEYIALENKMRKKQTLSLKLHVAPTRTNYLH